MLLKITLATIGFVYDYIEESGTIEIPVQKNDMYSIDSEEICDTDNYTKVDFQDCAYSDYAYD